MKKYLFILSFFIIAISMQSQNAEGFFRIYFRLGNSSYSKAPSALGLDKLPFEYSLKRSPVLQFQIHRNFVKWFDLGFAVTNQNFFYENFNYKFHTSNGLDSAHLSYNLNRLNISVVTIFNYVNNKQIKVYSGIRNGLTLWMPDYNLNTNQESYLIINHWHEGFAYAPQIILLGFDFNFIDAIGCNFELAFGSPYYAIFGIHYTFS